MSEEVCGFVSEGWTPRNEALMEAVLKQVGTTRHTWLIACDANTCPEYFKKKPLVSKQTHVHLGARRRRFNLQIQRPRVRFDGENARLCCRQSRPAKKDQKYVGGGRLRIKTQRVPSVARAKNDLKHFQDSAVESCQSEAKRKKEEKKKRRRKVDRWRTSW